MAEISGRDGILERLMAHRRQAGSHRFSAKPVDCAVPVGAGLPAMGPPRSQAMSRNSRRRILPTGVIGNESRSTMCLGTLYPVKLTLQ